MHCLKVTPYGSVLPGLAASVSDSAELGQTMTLLYTDDDDSTFPFGPDLMPSCWHQRETWALGYYTLSQVGTDPGWLILLDYKLSIPQIEKDGMIRGENAKEVCPIFHPRNHNVIGSLWEVYPNGIIQGRNWSLAHTKTQGLLIHPLLAGQRV